MSERRNKFIKNGNKKFNNFYNYEKFIYECNTSKSIVECPIHGEFNVVAATHVSNSKYGGCHECLKLKRTNLYYEDCKKIAFKYETRGDFQKNDVNFYQIAYRNGWLDEICSHMKKVGNMYKRCIYVYEFELLKFVYIGLTYDINIRDSQHRTLSTSSAVRDFSIKNDVKIPKIKKLTDYIKKEDASKLEGEILSKYEKKGWSILNRIKTGGLGGNKGFLYTKEMCFEIAKQYSKVSDCEKENFKVCQILRKNNWIKEAFSHVFDKFKIVCFNSSGEFYKIYDNSTLAAIELKLNASVISKCTKGKTNYAGNYKFIKHGEWIKMGSPDKIAKINKRHINSVKVIQMSLNSEFLNEFESIADAVKFLDINENCRSSITKACRGRLKTAYGYKWKYK